MNSNCGKATVGLKYSNMLNIAGNNLLSLHARAPQSLTWCGCHLKQPECAAMLDTPVCSLTMSPSLRTVLFLRRSPASWLGPDLPRFNGTRSTKRPGTITWTGLQRLMRSPALHLNSSQIGRNTGKMHWMEVYKISLVVIYHTLLKGVPRALNQWRLPWHHRCRSPHDKVKCSYDQTWSPHKSSSGSSSCEGFRATNMRQLPTSRRWTRRSTGLACGLPSRKVVVSTDFSTNVPTEETSLPFSSGDFPLAPPDGSTAEQIFWISSRTLKPLNSGIVDNVESCCNWSTTEAATYFFMSCVRPSVTNWTFFGTTKTTRSWR